MSGEDELEEVAGKRVVLKVLLDLVVDWEMVEEWLSGTSGRGS